MFDLLDAFSPSAWASSYLMFFWLCVATFIAAYVRAFTGFGFALLAVPSFLFVLPPETAVLLSITLDLIGALALLPTYINRTVSWGSVRYLLLGSIPAIPIGIYFSKLISANIYNGFIGGLLLVLSLLLVRGYRFKKNISNLFVLLIGIISGVLGGIAGMFGPPIILFFMSSVMGHVAGRASMMAYFIVCLIITFCLHVYNVSNVNWVYPLPILFIFLMIGTYLGYKKFKLADEDTFRKIAYGVLLFLSLSLILKAIN